MSSWVIKIITILAIMIGPAYFISSMIATKLDRITTIDHQQVDNPECDNEIMTETGMVFGLGACTYIVTAQGWPLTVVKEYTFLAIEKPNQKYGFTISPTAIQNKEVEYTQLSPELSDPDFLCGSKSCLFQSDNHVIAFVLLLLVSVPSWIAGVKFVKRCKRRSDTDSSPTMS